MTVPDPAVASGRPPQTSIPPALTGGAIPYFLPDQQPSRWQPLPHPMMVILTVFTGLIGISSFVTAYFNYKEALRNNLQPPLLSITAYLIRPPQGMDSGEFEFAVRNDGKTAAQQVKIRQAIGIALRPYYSRGGTDPDRSAAYFSATAYGEREVMLQALPKIVRQQGSFRRHQPSIDVLGPGQPAILRLDGGFYMTPAFEDVIAKDKAFFVIAGTVVTCPPKTRPAEM
jgi:hypothetical protein